MPASRLYPALCAALLWALVGIISIYAFRQDPGLTSLASALGRVVVNLILVILIHRWLRGRRGLPWGDKSRNLWIWGVLGASTITSFFIAIKNIGIGEATLLQGAQGMLVALLAPRFLGEKYNRVLIFGSCVGILGLALLLGETFIGENLVGRAWGLFSGLSAGFAYLLLSGERGRHHPDTISFYWCLGTLFVVGLLLVCLGSRLPEKNSTYALLLVSGLVASLAQWLTTYAYAKAPAPHVSATSYLIPGIGFGMEYFAFGQVISVRTITAAALVFTAGFILPLWATPK